MKTRFGYLFSIAMGAIGMVGSAQAQQASPQYYGYQGPQQPAPSGQANYTCQPGTPACYPQKYGCHVTMCPCPCNAATTQHELNSKIPPIHPVPSCHEPNVVTIVDEGPPTVPPHTVTIHRNCYVPIKVVTQPGPHHVTPVNIQVNWREVHVLCGPDGKPLTSEQSAAMLEKLNAQVAAGVAPAADPAAPAADAAPAAPAVSAAPQPAAEEATAVAPQPKKTWVWLKTQNVYGFGYQRPDGYWVIDPESKRPTLPENAATEQPQQQAAAAPTITAAN